MIIPFFIKNRGCPHRCVFCNQQISGDRGPADWTDESFHERVRIFLATHVSKATQAKGVQIAFYGGNFTGLAAAEQNRLLGMAHSHVENCAVEGIRISTRPDALHVPDMERLAAFGVKSALAFGCRRPMPGGLPRFCASFPAILQFMNRPPRTPSGAGFSNNH